MTVNIAVNLGSHTLFMTDRLRTVSENGVTSRDDEFASKISTVKSGMACHAGRVGSINGTSLALR